MLGELRCLIGHLAENDLHGKLSFIERALGINKARELYQQVEKCQLSQRELAEHLKNDGYPINQSHIGRMEQALEYLLPCIPEVLYAGMGRSQVEKLLSLRSASLHSGSVTPPKTTVPLTIYFLLRYRCSTTSLKTSLLNGCRMSCWG